MYNRLFQKILDSSIWLEPDHVRLVFVTMIAAMDENGVVNFACAQNVADRARVTLCNAESAIGVLESPDKFNPHQEHDGRRIERIEGGWLILNAKKYNSYINREIEKENTRQRVARYRAKKKNEEEANKKTADVTPCNTNVTPCNTGNVTVTVPLGLVTLGLSDLSLQEKQEAPSAQVEESKRKSYGSRIPDDFAMTPEMREYATAKGVWNAESEFETFKNYWQAKSGTGARKADWVKTWQVWCARAGKGATNGISERARRGYIAPLPSKPDDIF